uniref:Receptor kinase-like protein Xa21 n=1 Tax=Ananas comosus var. bracteatus TaxID=296719 RepID=A0A6V7QIV8_ANACO|nr:unnamed protein product [Ananas comosus var. bracteatus]
MIKVIIVISSVALCSLLCLLILWRLLRKSGKTSTDTSYLEDKNKKVSYNDIVKATNGFSSDNLVGSGSFGSVYVAKFDFTRNVVAVKVFNILLSGAVKSFSAECAALRNIRHRNLLKVITSCSSIDFAGNEFRALIFEYMPNGNLENWLHPNVSGHPQTRRLNLKQRLNIAADVAFALKYLHHHSVSPIVHCDLKPSNILLDNDMNACVGDFGLARFLSLSHSTTSTTNSTSLIALKGSIGYVAPEYGTGSRISTQGDVYSYGILLLELLTGKKPTSDLFQDGSSLRKYVETAFPEKLAEVLDPVISEEEEGLDSNDESEDGVSADLRMQRCIVPLAEIGLLCSAESPRGRMTMQDVATQISAIKEAYSIAGNSHHSTN